MPALSKSRQVATLSDTIVSVKDFGAVGDGVTDDTAAFSAASATSTNIEVPKNTFNLTTSPTGYANPFWILNLGAAFAGSGKLPGSIMNLGRGHMGQWTGNISIGYGIYDYLESEASLSVLADKGIAITGAARTSTGGALASDAHIGVAGFSYNDYPAGACGAWGLYSTNVRLAAATGPTQGIEIDVANLGTTAAIYPAFLSPTGLTAGAWIASGGEITNQIGDGTGSASVAIGIVRNDAQNRTSVNWDKGIVFGNSAIAGTTGTSGFGIAIAFASCHFMQWYNNSNSPVGSIGCTVQTASNGQSIQITDGGIIFSRVSDSSTQFQISTTATATNWAAINAATVGAAPSISASGSDTNIDIAIYPKGSGVLKVGTYTASVLSPTGYITIKDSSGNTRRLLVG